MATPNEFALFKPYLLATKEWLKRVCYLTRYSPEDNVKVEWSTPAKAFVKYIIPLVERENGSLKNPLITMSLSAMTPAGSGETPGQWYKLQVLKADKSGSSELYHPCVFSLGININIYTSLQSDMDILLFQLLTNSIHRKAAFIVEEQWCEIGGGEPTNQTNSIPPEAQDKVIKYSMDLKIPRAYLPIDVVSRDIITKVEVNYEML